MEIDDLVVGKLSYESKQYHCKNPQLILISLEDEKIEVEDKYFVNATQSISTATIDDVEDLKKCIARGYKPHPKVIATQDQLPESYIQQFIEEYNKGEVKDVEIEMDTTRDEHKAFNRGFESGINRNDKILYTEEEVYTMLLKLQTSFPIHRMVQITTLELKEWFEQNKKP